MYCLSFVTLHPKMLSRIPILSEGKMSFNSKKASKKIPAKIYPVGFYEEILKCYEYESRNPSVYGNVIRCEMEFAESSEECRVNQQGDENHV